MTAELVTEKTSKQKKTQLNYIKTRDDADIVIFEDLETGKFKLAQDTKCSWLNEGQKFSERELRPRIEPWLTSLFQSEHLSLLAGSGLTHAVHHLATGNGAASMGASIPFSRFANEIIYAAKVSAKDTERKEGNIEDQIRVANELLRGLEILCDSNADIIRSELINALGAFSESILKSETGIAIAPEESREKHLTSSSTF